MSVYRTIGPLVYMYITILVKHVYWYISRVSGERLQDHWSSGICRLSKKFMDFVNKIKSTDAIFLKLLYICNQFNMNKCGKFQINHLINF